MAQPPLTGSIEMLRTDSSVGDCLRNVLVSLTGMGNDHQLVYRAGTYAASTGGKIVLLSVMPDREFADRQRAYAQINALPQYALDQAEEVHRQTAAQIGHEALDPLGLDYTPVGRVGHEVNHVLNAAQTYNCGHVFLLDRQQSVLHRLVARDPAQSVVNRFNGFVTVLQDERGTETAVERRVIPRLGGRRGLRQ